MPGSLPIVYVETSVISYLTGRLSRDIVIAANQQVTAAWWEGAAERFTVVASTAVVDEAERGNPAKAAARVALLRELPLLPVSVESVTLARHLLRGGLLPPRAAADALHVAVAAVGGADYLATWNMRHLAGAPVRRRIERALRAGGLEPPMLCTPGELLPPHLLSGGSDVP